MERSFVMIKPGFANNPEVIDYVKSRLTKIGLEVVSGEFKRYSTNKAQEHYAEHFRGSYENAKPFYKELENYITSDKVYGMEVVGDNAISKIREVVGSTIKTNKETGEQILPAKGTIRYEVPVMLGEPHQITQNVVHASDAPEAATRELEIFKTL
ncbi:MAG: nucleoside-diphosphate kinase [Clostridia bacterium]|nr:nucleoside-diphosphate kinase [Clostridia bacterium]